MEESEEMKRPLKGVVACAIALMVVAGMGSLAEAGGKINWKTRVTNSTDGDASVDLFYGVGGGQIKNRTIPKGYSYTFETGKECPVRLEGMTASGWFIIGKDMNGAGGVNCADSEWSITQFNIGQYRFDKK
jgi:hypothetical protein